MKTIVIIFTLLVFASCSSVPKTGDNQADVIIAHMSKGSTVVGKPFEEKFTKDGLIDGEYIAIGRSSTYHRYDTEFDVDKTKAFADGQVRLLRSAPSDFKKILMTSISSMNSGNLTVDESSITITEVKALTGMFNHYSDYQCVLFAEPTEDLKYKFRKECRTLVRVPASNLEKSFKYTLDKKYGISDAQLKENLNNDLMNKLVNESNVNLTDVDKISGK